MLISLESLNVPGHFIRFKNGLGELTSVPSFVDKGEATFIWTGGWYYGAKGMLRAAFNHPLVLRHRNFRLEFANLPDLDIPLQPQVVADSTFILRRGQANISNPQMVSFESANLPVRFIRHRNFNLWVEPAPWTQQPAASDATFIIRNPLAIPTAPPLT